MKPYDYLLSIMHSGNDKIAAEYMRKNPNFASDRKELDGWLWLAVRKGSTETIRTLVAMGADLDQKPQGKSLVRWAPRGRDDVKRLLRSIKSEAVIASAMNADTAPAARTPSPSSMVL